MNKDTRDIIVIILAMIGIITLGHKILNIEGNEKENPIKITVTSETDNENNGGKSNE